jgi:hypothetical protein
MTLNGKGDLQKFKKSHFAKELLKKSSVPYGTLGQPRRLNLFTIPPRPQRDDAWHCYDDDDDDGLSSSSCPLTPLVYHWMDAMALADERSASTLLFLLLATTSTTTCCHTAQECGQDHSQDNNQNISTAITPAAASIPRLHCQ